MSRSGGTSKLGKPAGAQGTTERGRSPARKPAERPGGRKGTPTTRFVPLPSGLPRLPARLDCLGRSPALLCLHDGGPVSNFAPLHDVQRRRILLSSIAVSAALCAAVVSALSHISELPTFGVDDANIFFVYARNLVDGHGVVYNAGSERVEGFSSPIWMLVCALGFWLSEAPEAGLFGASLAMVATTLALAIFFLLTRPAPLAFPGRRPEQVVIPLLVFLAWMAAQPSFWFWSAVALMEGGLWTLIVTASSLTLLAAIHAHQGAPTAPPSRGAAVTLSVLIALALLCRPESLAWAALVASVFAIHRFGTANDPMERRWLLLPLAVYGAGVAALSLFRMSYFGYPLPNTFYAKVSPDTLYNLREGWDYLFRYSRELLHLPLGILALSLTAILLSVRRTPDPRQWALPLRALVAGAALLIGFVSTVVYEGGDHFAGYRLLQPAHPLFPIILLYALLVLGTLPRRTLAPSQREIGSSIASALLVCLLAWNSQSLWEQWRPTQKRLLLQPLWGRGVGRHLSAAFGDRAALPTLGVVAAGGLKFGYPGDVIDLEGLNSLAISHNQGSRKGIAGHAAFERGDFFRLLPEIFYARPATGPIAPKSLTGISYYLKDLLHDPRFLERYVLTRIHDPQSLYGFDVEAFLRRDLFRSSQKEGRLQLGTVPLVLQGSQGPYLHHDSPPPWAPTR